ncbi:MAG: hypothetical protein PHS97_04940 [Oscillospiraceae bacterium]|nr:hypothetical protein [Oscillospiraceae bacterium]
MTLTERAAYLKGLKEGLKLNTETSEGKLIDAIIEMLDDVALTVTDLEDTTDAISDELDLIGEELDEIEDCIDDEIDDEDEDYDDDDDYAYEDGTVYEVKCPTCGEVITLDEDMLLEGGMKCPKCGEDLEFSAEEDTEE